MNENGGTRHEVANRDHRDIRVHYEHHVDRVNTLLMTFECSRRSAPNTLVEQNNRVYYHHGTEGRKTFVVGCHVERWVESELANDENERVSADNCHLGFYAIPPQVF